MNTIFYLGLTGAILYTLISILIQVSKSNERNDMIETARNDYNKAEIELSKSKEKLLKSIGKSYGSEIEEKVSKGTIWIGMPLHLLLASSGKASEIKDSFYKTKKIEKWYYGKFVNRLGNTKYTLEVTLEDNEVVGWQDLK